MGNIPKGYKQTEVGVIPEDWVVKKLGEITRIFVGRDLKEVNFSSYQDNIYQYPVYSNTVDNDGRYGYYNISEYQGDSLTIVGRGVGLGTAFKRNGGYGAIGRLLVLFPDRKVDTGYLTEYINHRVKIFEESSGIPQLTGISIAKYNIPLPTTKAEQTAIAAALSDADALISSLEKLIAKKRNIKQGAMQELLSGKKRLPGFNEEWEVKKGYKQTEVGVIPEDWEVKKLGDYVKITSGQSPSKFRFKSNGVPYFKVEQLNNSSKYQKETPYYIATDNTVPKGSVIFPKRGASILLNKIRILEEDSFMDTNLMTLSLSEELSNEYLFYILTHYELWRIADTTSIPQINNKHVTPLNIPLPPTKAEQTAIAQILSDMDAEIEQLEQKLDKYRMIKQGMMQELLTGKTRLI